MKERNSSLTSFDALSVSRTGRVVAGAEEWDEAGRTELILRHHNPTFQSTLSHTYEMNKHQELKLAVYHIKSGFGGHIGAVPLSSPDCVLIGEAITTVSSIVGNMNLSLDLSTGHKGASLGQLNVALKETFFSNFRVTFRFGMNRTVLGQRLFLEFARQRNDAEYQTIFRSPASQSVPSWDSFDLSAQAVSGGDPTQQLKVRQWQPQQTHFASSFQSTSGIKRGATLYLGSLKCRSCTWYRTAAVSRCRSGVGRAVLKVPLPPSRR